MKGWLNTYSYIFYISKTSFSIVSIGNILFNRTVEENWLLAHYADLQKKIKSLVIKISEDNQLNQIFDQETYDQVCMTEPCESVRERE